MPFSHSTQISTILNYVEHLNPISVLDVGFGMAQYGFLLRLALEGANLFQVDATTGHGRHSYKSEWRVRIDGIDGCGGYVTPVHEYCYNNLIIGDALAILPTLVDDSYQLVLAIDILEHLSKSDGLVFLAQLKRVASQAALISTPKVFIPQTVAANPYEDHRSLWTQTELAAQQFQHELTNDTSWIAIYQQQDALTVER
jgi:hypothetical protein